MVFGFLFGFVFVSVLFCFFLRTEGDLKCYAEPLQRSGWSKSRQLKLIKIFSPELLTALTLVMLQNNPHLASNRHNIPQDP